MFWYARQVWSIHSFIVHIVSLCPSLYFLPFHPLPIFAPISRISKNWLGEDILDQAMHMSIEGSPTLSKDDIVTHWKDMKPRR